MMQRIRNIAAKIGALVLLIILLSSCGASKNNAYLQDMESGRGYIISQKPIPFVRVNDRIDIFVKSKTPELALPFNKNYSGIEVTEEGEIKSATQSAVQEKKGYLVDPNGNIDFPILGRLHVEGLTLNQLSELIADKIIEGKYLSDPVVTVEFLNFKFYVLGAVSSKGEHSIDQTHVTLLEALAIAGDLTADARIDRVAVIRSNDGSQIMYMHDLTSKEVFESPGYYLRQNDIIYVETKEKTFRDQTRENLSFISTVLSSLTAVISIIFLTRKL